MIPQWSGNERWQGLAKYKATAIISFSTGRNGREMKTEGQDARLDICVPPIVDLRALALIYPRLILRTPNTKP